nr:hypothetical protein [Candidatus Njordarchaeota archaeon]
MKFKVEISRKVRRFIARIGKEEGRQILDCFQSLRAIFRFLREAEGFL